jgi:hypothetical protein
VALLFYGLHDRCQVCYVVVEVLWVGGDPGTVVRQTGEGGGVASEDAGEAREADGV